MKNTVLVSVQFNGQVVSNFDTCKPWNSIIKSIKNESNKYTALLKYRHCFVFSATIVGALVMQWIFSNVHSFDNLSMHTLMKMQTCFKEQFWYVYSQSFSHMHISDGSILSTYGTYCRISTRNNHVVALQSHTHSQLFCQDKTVDEIASTLFPDHFQISFPLLPIAAIYSKL